MRNQAIQVGEVRPLDSEVATADVVNSLIVNHETAVGMLKCGVGSEDRVVRLNNGSCNFLRRVNAEFQLALLAVVDRETFHQECSKTRTSTTTKGVENKETLEARAVVGYASYFVENLVDQLLADSVVTSGVVVGCILLSSDHLLRVEETAVSTGADFIDNIRLEITVDCARNIFAVS